MIEQIALNAIRYRSDDEHDAEAMVRADRGWLLRYIARHDVQRQWPRDPDPYHFAKMLADELRRVEGGSATPDSIRRTIETWERGAEAVANGTYAVSSN